MRTLSLIKRKDYEVHAITTVYEGKMNANIATWVMQSAMKGKAMSVALAKEDYTIELVRKSGIFNINFLSQEQVNLVRLLGKRSGRQCDKFERLPYALDLRNCPYLLDSIGYIACEVLGSIDSLDHQVFVASVVEQKILHPEKVCLTYHYLREKGIVS